MIRICIISVLAILLSFTSCCFAADISEEKYNATRKMNGKEIQDKSATNQIVGPRQYKPISYQINSTYLIVYPVKDENPLDQIFSHNKEEMLMHLKNLYVKHSNVLSKGEYHILFVWNLDGHKMTDVWVHNMKNWSDSGPLMDCYTFKDLEVTHDAGIASGDSIIALGREEELRRKLGSKIGLKDYADRKKYIPEFPEGLQPTESFFTN